MRYPGPLGRISLYIWLLLLPLGTSSTSIAQEARHVDAGKFFLKLERTPGKSSNRVGMVITILGRHVNIYRDYPAGRLIDTVATLDEASIISLARLIDSVGFFGMNEWYGENCQDSPTSRLYIRSNGLSNSVRTWCVREARFDAIFDSVIELTDKIEFGAGR
jgi:hypothetical protein